MNLRPDLDPPQFSMSEKDPGFRQHRAVRGTMKGLYAQLPIVFAGWTKSKSFE